MDKKKGQTTMKKLVYIATVILSLQSSCKDNPTNSEKPENRSPVISSLTVFPEVARPADSLIVICSATDPDGDTLVYDWITTGIVRIKGALPGVHSLYNTYENTRVFYAPDSLHVQVPQDTFWVQCFARDRRGRSDAQLVLFIIENGP
jgi:hypothetical protein